jgi:hypothetical protein
VEDYGIKQLLFKRAPIFDVQEEATLLEKVRRDLNSRSSNVLITLSCSLSQRYQTAPAAKPKKGMSKKGKFALAGAVTLGGYGLYSHFLKPKMQQTLPAETEAPLSRRSPSPNLDLKTGATISSKGKVGVAGKRKGMTKTKGAAAVLGLAGVAGVVYEAASHLNRRDVGVST